MRHKAIYWVIPLSILGLGLLPKALTMDTVRSGGITSNGPISVPADSMPDGDRLAINIQPHLTTLNNRDMFGSNIATEALAPKMDVVETELWSDFEYQFVGVTKSNGRRLALFIEPNSQTKTNLRQGETLDGWTITKVLSSRVELTREDQKLWVELFKPEGE